MATWKPTHCEFTQAKDGFCSAVYVRQLTHPPFLNRPSIVSNAMFANAALTANPPSYATTVLNVRIKKTVSGNLHFLVETIANQISGALLPIANAGSPSRIINSKYNVQLFRVEFMACASGECSLAFTTSTHVAVMIKFLAR